MPMPIAAALHKTFEMSRSAFVLSPISHISQQLHVFVVLAFDIVVMTRGQNDTQTAKTYSAQIGRRGSDSDYS